MVMRNEARWLSFLPDRPPFFFAFKEGNQWMRLLINNNNQEPDEVTPKTERVK